MNTRSHHSNIRRTVFWRAAYSTVSLIAISLAASQGTQRAHAQAVSVTDGTTVAVPGPLFPASTYTTTAAGQPGVGFFSANGSVINGTNVDITTNGDLAYGIFVNSGSSAIIMNGGSITTTATTGSGVDSAFGARANGTGRLELHGTSISTAGINAQGVSGNFSSDILLDGVSISTTGDLAGGVVVVFGFGSTTGIQVTNGTTITTTGFDAAGILAGAGTTINVSDSTITTQGDNSIGLFATALAQVAL